ncbi:MAG: PIN domain-containing protein [Thaumarchaeota archaeon]|nr:PIN domain-containing protein [Nitrososphaerota archaeon]
MAAEQKSLGQNITNVSRIFELKNLEWIPLIKEIFLTASALMEEYDLGAFDAYMAATALSKDRIIVSSDHVYDKITRNKMH